MIIKIFDEYIHIKIDSDMKITLKCWIMKSGIFESKEIRAHN